MFGMQALIVVSRTGIYIPLSGVDVNRFAESMQVRHTSYLFAGCRTPSLRAACLQYHRSRQSHSQTHPLKEARPWDASLRHVDGR